jgi:hypothetical protein
MSSLKKQARFAGLLYFVGALITPIGIMYVPLRLIVKGDAAATADNIRASESLFRLGIASELAGAIIFLFVVLALYHLFKGVNQKHALAMAILLMISFPISFATAVNNFAAMYLVSGVDYLSMFDKSQLDGLAYLSLRLHSAGLMVASIFWGLWLFPFGWLVIRSGFIPRFLGVFLWIAGSGYVIDATTSILLPQFTDLLSPVLMGMILLEAPIIFWLLIWGAREKTVVAEASS